MALKEAHSDNKDEVIFHRNGKVTEGSASNIFVIFKDLILTPPTSHQILSGVTRKYVISLLKSKNLNVLEEEIDIKKLYQADEVWMTSSTKEIQPIRKIDERQLNSINPLDSLWFNALSIFI